MSLISFRGPRLSGGERNRQSPHLPDGSMKLINDAKCRVAGQTHPCVVAAAADGRVLLEFTTPNADFTAKNSISIEITSGGETIIAGDWFIASQANAQGCSRYTLERPFHSFLTPIQHLLSPTSAWLPSHIAVLYLAVPGGTSSMATHIADLKDSPISTSVTVSGSFGSAIGKFDFSDEIAQMSGFAVNIGADSFGININAPVIVEYVFCSVRYIFSTTLKEFDSNFGDLILDMPQAIVAVTNRRHWRAKCDVRRDSQVADGQKLSTLITHISPTGALANIRGITDDHLGKKICLFEGENPAIRGIIAAVQSDVVAISFDTPHRDDIKPMLQLFAATLGESEILRTPENRWMFLDLYRQVGYGPNNEIADSEWALKTTEVWNAQDTELPGNNLGLFIKGSLEVSFGTLPVSANAVYGHSLAMLKTLDAIGHLFEAMVRSLWWTDLLPGIRYYIGAARHTSRFSTRLFTSIQSHAAAGDIVFPAMKVFPPPATLSTSSGLRMTTCTLDEALVVLNESPLGFRSFYSSMVVPSEWLHELQQASPFLVYDDSGSPIASGLRRRCKLYFTAADILNFDAIFFPYPQSIPWTALISLFAPTGYPVEIFVPGQMVSRDGLDNGIKSTPKEWYFIPRDDLGPIVASFGRSIYQVIRKYGDAARAYLERVL